ncbi:LysE family translocator [Balneatrix alpica]|uniref:LysE family translocator n=1 Tax=Balneatrix alpica TaxID=75684 RepID=A0ABV5ZDF4_9GAMM|nr:LysE family transporter [Balneatrix alpica]
MWELYWSEWLIIAGIHLLAVASPGPDFALILRQSIQYGRRVAIISSVGVGMAIMLHVAYSLLGIGVIVSQSVLLFNLMKYAAAAYLIYVGYKALRARPQNLDALQQAQQQTLPSARQAWFSGFLTNGLNPKATLFFLSLFTAVISPTTPLEVQLAYGIYMAVATTLWFILVSLLFSGARVRGWFKRLGHWFERIMGGILILLGVKIAGSSV